MTATGPTWTETGRWASAILSGSANVGWNSTQATDLNVGPGNGYWRISELGHQQTCGFFQGRSIGIAGLGPAMYQAPFSTVFGSCEPPRALK
ncbi:MAG: hypothetical protein ACYSYV_01550 [Planctomycetota bacterium]